MRTRYQQVCKNCGHTSHHHTMDDCFHDVGHKDSRPPGSMFTGIVSRKPEKDLVPCGCKIWRGITVPYETFGEGD